jgi:hypothetical protein
VTLSTSAPPTSVLLDGSTRVAVGFVPAKELIALPGITDLTLFAPNVRLGLGKTRVNKELERTVTTAEEHALFPAYHNGLTVLTHRLKVNGNVLNLDGVSVSNGCQSILTLHGNQGSLTDDLSLLVKVVQVDPHSDLPEKITYRANNQNSVDIRDQRSRDPIQRALQAEVEQLYDGEFGYAIRRGETVNAKEVLTNEQAAQLAMAVYAEQPWNAVRKVRLFDEDYRKIFNRALDAHRLYLLHVISKVLGEARASLRSDLAASFASVRLTLAHLLAQVLRESERGRDLLEHPGRWLPDLADTVQAELAGLLEDVVISVNFHIEEEKSDKGDEFDPKVVFKSQTGVRGVEGDVLRAARRDARKDEDYLFDLDPIRSAGQITTPT